MLSYFRGNDRSIKVIILVAMDVLLEKEKMKRALDFQRTLLT